MLLLDILKDRPEELLVPNESLQKDALRGLKEALDNVAAKYSPLNNIHTDGLKAEQIWVQAQMVLEGVTEKLNSVVDELSAQKTSEVSDEEASEDFSEEDEEEDDDEEEEEDDDDEEEDDIKKSKQLKHALEEGAEDSEELDLDDMHDDYEESDLEEEDDENEVRAANSNTGEEHSEDSSSEAEEPKTDNFDLAEFQQHVLKLEQEDEDEDDENIDYNAEIEDSSDDADMHYEDFFGPAPTKKAKKEKKVKFAAADEEDEEDEEQEEDEQLDDAMQTTRKDLFDDEGEDDNLYEEGSGETLSKFERQQRELSEQIAELENENVGQKEWGMRGEAQAKDRPEDSLFTIQFDRNAKPAPVITLEATASIEELIKERIRKQQFDDLPRRSELNAPTQRKELPELSDAKSQKSLAEQYEEDQMREANPDYFAKQDSAALDAAHREVIDLFNSVTRRLDALCSWQYTPRAPAPSLTVVSDSPSISMEEAQPGTMAAGAHLAPQEVYKGDSAAPMANQEMSTSLKRKKRRDKAKAKTQGTSESGKPSKRTKKEEMFSTLKKGNVTLVDKRGNKRDMRGQEVKNKAPPSAAQIKL